jgi:hypothetical protein
MGLKMLSSIKAAHDWASVSGKVFTKECAKSKTCPGSIEQKNQFNKVLIVGFARLRNEKAHGQHRPSQNLKRTQTQPATALSKPAKSRDFHASCPCPETCP